MYGTLYKGEKESFWTALEDVVSAWQEHWLIVGDMNEVANSGEKLGAEFQIREDGSLIILYRKWEPWTLATRKRFTWENIQEGMSYIKE